MKVVLFHKDVFLPEGTTNACFILQKNLKSFFLSRHFEEHIKNQVIEDRSHTYLKDVIIECLNSLKDTPRSVFEVELGKDFHKFGKSGWFVTKYCCRIPYSATQDLVVAIRPVYEGTTIKDNMVVTAWMNSNTDHHYTLDESKYCSEEEWNEVR